MPCLQKERYVVGSHEYMGLPTSNTGRLPNSMAGTIGCAAPRHTAGVHQPPPQQWLACVRRTACTACACAAAKALAQVLRRRGRRLRATSRCSVGRQPQLLRLQHDKAPAAPAAHSTLRQRQPVTRSVQNLRTPAPPVNLGRVAAEPQLRKPGNCFVTVLSRHQATPHATRVPC
jgi:hypothetical protein